MKKHLLIWIYVVSKLITGYRRLIRLMWNGKTFLMYCQIEFRYYCGAIHVFEVAFRMLFATSIKLYPNKNDASICMETGQPIKGIYQISRARSNVFFPIWLNLNLPFTQNLKWKLFQRGKWKLSLNLKKSNF